MKNIENPTISIIVPIYNAEKYLRRCVDSILVQTFTDFELLLINDGSIDKSGEICDEYALIDSRVHTYHKENGGVSSARNLGLQKAKGIWITFVDSDDWIANSYLKSLYGSSQQDVDFVISFATLVFNNGVQQRPYKLSSLLKRDNYYLLFTEYQLHIYTSPWGKLYLKSLIDKNELSFCEDMHIGEDLLFLYSYILKTDNIYLTSYSGYYYYFELADTLTKRINSLESEIIGYKNICNVVDRIKDKWKFNSTYANSNLEWIKGAYTRRLLNSLYYNDIVQSARLAVIRSIDLSPYLRYMDVKSYKEKVYVFLLGCRMYHIYDLMRCMICKIKKCGIIKPINNRK